MLYSLSEELTRDTAYAHSLPVTENPAPNSIIKKTVLPSNVTIDFSERPSPTISTIQVLNSKNEPVNNGDFKIIGDHDREAMTSLNAKNLTDGVYTVSWQTRSLDDGHIAKGSYVFGIGDVGPSGARSIPGGGKNSTYVVQSKITNVNTKIEINPFYAGFNTFKVTFIDPTGKPYSKVSTAEITFNNNAADIGPIVANLHKIAQGVYSVTGGYLSQPGTWDIALSAQRFQDLDLNYEFTANVSNPVSASDTNTHAIRSEPTSAPNFESIPWNSFAWLLIALSTANLISISSPHAVIYNSSGVLNMTNSSEQISGMNIPNMVSTPAAAPSTNNSTSNMIGHHVNKSIEGGLHEPLQMAASQTNQTGNKSTLSQNYNATDVMISSHKSGKGFLMQAVNDIRANNIRKALIDLNNTRVQIEQQQLSSLVVMSNPVLQSAREHLVAAKRYIETGSTDKAISELNILMQLKKLHQQGMMTMKLPMKGDLNSTFSSAEVHLLAADEALNAYDPQRAISQLNIASEQLYAHQLAMLEVINSLYNNTRTHLQQSINDIKNGDNQGAISELSKVIMSLDEHEQGVLMIKGISPSISRLQL